MRFSVSIEHEDSCPKVMIRLEAVIQSLRLDPGIWVWNLEGNERNVFAMRPFKLSSLIQQRRQQQQQQVCSMRINRIAGGAV